MTDVVEVKHARTVTGGGIGGALGVLVVLFMPGDVHVFTPETASVATAAFGIVFSYLVRFLPQPKN
ncbi:hypothetical protein LCGC14_2752020 [marine sediment metagenome]|uniref:Uncharacterized protein n=1 Tax=marine sediment metagenome TaxID=412755 RepID=A0A0F9BA35_9ZZZZ